MDRVNALKKTEMFGALKITDLETIATAFMEKKLQKGEILFSKDDESQNLYVIVRGSLRAYRENTDGREQIIHLERAGTTIAEVPVFDDKPYPSSVLAEEESEVLFISKENVRKLCLKYPLIALCALKLMASRLRKTAALVESLSLKEVDQRLAVFLLQEFQENKLKKFKLPSTASMAARLGSVREVVSRSLTKLEKEGFISIDPQRYVILTNALKLENFIQK